MKAVIRKVGFTENKIILTIGFYYYKSGGIVSKVMNILYSIKPFATQRYELPLSATNENILNFTKGKITDFAASHKALSIAKILKGKRIFIDNEIPQE